MKRRFGIVILIAFAVLACSNEQREIERLVAQGESDKVIPRIHLQIRNKGDNGALRVLLTKAYLNKGDAEQALEQFQQAVRLDPGQEPFRETIRKALIEQGQKFFSDQQYYQAAGPLRKAVELDPTNSELNAMLAATLVKTGRSNEAEEYLRKAASGEPKNGEVESTIADTYYNERRFIEAKEHYKRAVEAGYNNARIWARIAQIDLSVRDFGAAQTDLQKGLDLDTNSFDVRRTLGDFHNLISQLPDAEKQYRLALEIRPEEAETRAQLGMVLKKLGRIDEAESELIKATQADPGGVVALEYLMNVYFDKKEYDRYEDTCRSLLKIDPNHANARLGLSWLEQQRKKDGSSK